MFDIGFTEIILISIIGLVILGPQRLPAAIKTLGLWTARIRRVLTDIQQDIQEELNLDSVDGGRTTILPSQDEQKTDKSSVKNDKE